MRGAAVLMDLCAQQPAGSKFSERQPESFLRAYGWCCSQDRIRPNVVHRAANLPPSPSTSVATCLRPGNRVAAAADDGVVDAVRLTWAANRHVGHLLEMPSASTGAFESAAFRGWTPVAAAFSSPAHGRFEEGSVEALRAVPSKIRLVVKLFRVS